MICKSFSRNRGRESRFLPFPAPEGTVFGFCPPVATERYLSATPSETQFGVFVVGEKHGFLPLGIAEMARYQGPEGVFVEEMLAIVHFRIEANFLGLLPENLQMTRHFSERQAPIAHLSIAVELCEFSLLVAEMGIEVYELFQNREIVHAALQPRCAHIVVTLSAPIRKIVLEKIAIELADEHIFILRESLVKVFREHETIVAFHSSEEFPGERMEGELGKFGSNGTYIQSFGMNYRKGIIGQYSASLGKGDTIVPTKFRLVNRYKHIDQPLLHKFLLYFSLSIR